MDARTVLFALHELERIGWKTILRLMNRFADISGILGCEADDLIDIGIQADKANTIANQLTEAFIYDKLHLYHREQTGFITIFDDAYPYLLKQTAQPPWVLYYKGDLSILAKPQLAVVGTRNPTAYGKKVAESFAAALSSAGLCIVSGLARGIDSSAHRGALSGDGSTIAVLGCGINIVYPPENAKLYDEIAERGLLLSEYPLGTAALPGLFPLRNRIIAGLALGTVVVEAAERSGSLITADQALEESRDVFAVPGPVTSPKSRGALALIKMGAKMAAGPEDILEEYAHLITAEQNTYINYHQAPSISEDERTIYGLLSPDPTTFDRLLELSSYNFGHLHSVLLSLLMKNLIRQLPGAAYITA